MILTQYQTISHSDKEFYLEYGWASCFECDIVFYDLKELDEHQKHCDCFGTTRIEKTTTK